ncbi:MAG: ABC transporter substrate-binding protein [Chloroflexota bacterium]|nr:ABC transporter substrate-binding protein [Chloroflexota bacterium]
MPLPTNADQQRELLARRLAAEDEDIDIMGMDVIWTAEFAEAGWIRAVPKNIAREVSENTLDGPLETARYEDRLWALPHNSNTQLLWYRADRVNEPPDTWDELIEQAEKIGDKGKIQVQAARYEGYVVWFNTLVESAGGQILTEEGEVALGPEAVEAARIIKKLAASDAAPPGLSNSREDSARLAFQSGDATFMVNYPYVFPSAKAEEPEVFENMRAALYPRVDPKEPVEVTLGGINLAVSAYSKHPEEAFDAALCLRSAENQIINAQKGGLPPTIERLYDTPQIKKAYPGFADLLEQSIRNGVPRPVTPAYSDISLVIQKTLHPPREIEPKETIAKLRERLEEVEEGGLY